MKGGRVTAAGLIAALGLAGPCAAEVLDIGPGGAMTSLRAPGYFTAPVSPPPGMAAAPGLLVHLPSDPPAPPSPAAAPAAPRPAPPAPAGFAMRIPPGAASQAVAAAATRHGVSPLVLQAVAWRESHFNPKAVSPKGALGIMQLMPATARALGVDPLDPVANIEGGAAYFGSLMRRFGGDLSLALAAYNAGPAAVDRWAGIPPYPETRAYVTSILGRLGAQAAPAR